MKPTTLIISLLLTTALFGQPRSKYSDCRLEVTIPGEFNSSEYEHGELTYRHKKHNSAIILSKSLKDRKAGLFRAKTVAMQYYDNKVGNTAISEETIELKEINGVEFFIISWVEKFDNVDPFYHIVALSETCNSIYELELSSEVKHRVKMRETFIEMLETTESDMAQVR